jgi:pimeloyl-ACP methyl ester carboxylesterase
VTRASRRLGAVAVCLGLLASACTTSGEAADPNREPGTTVDGSAPPSSADPSDPEEPAEPGAGTIDWAPCEEIDSFECGTLAVPLDHDDPAAGTLEIAVTRHRAEDPDRRLGVLLLNPGGPGASAIELAHGWPRAGELGDRFDIVGFDPRGVGDSSPLDCHTYLQDIYDADPTIDSDEDREAYLEASEAFVDECEERHGDVLPHLGTTDVARDMDEVRKALGEEQINYLGYSYGTSLGQEYARLFPTRVRAMILDGVVDHAPDGLTTAATQATGFETAFDSYLADCADDGCGFGGRDAVDVVDEVIALAEDEPIPAPEADRPATPGVVSLAMAYALYSEQLWGSLSRALRDALEGDGSGLVDLADSYLSRNPDGSYPTGFEIYFGVGCLDDTWPDDPDEVLDAAAEAERETPRFGGAIVADYLRCALWPAESQPLAPVPADTEGLPPILVVSTTGDPATPYENGVRVAEQIPGAVLLTNEGEGHTIVALGKPCIDEAATTYLVDLEPPADGTTCD